VVAAWIPVAVVFTSLATVAIDTFMTELSSVIRNCCDCGDDPDLDYREVLPGLQPVRGPYPIEAGAAAYDEHLKLNHGLVPISQVPPEVAEGL
jgi:hypothetical protein